MHLESTGFAQDVAVTRAVSNAVSGSAFVSRGCEENAMPAGYTLRTLNYCLQHDRERIRNSLPIYSKSVTQKHRVKYDEIPLNEVSRQNESFG